MRKTSILAIALASASLLACTNNRNDKSTTESDRPSTTEEISVDTKEHTYNINEEVILKNGFKSQKGLPTVVDFWATWCGPCQQFKPVFHKAEAEYDGKIEFLAIDVDSYPAIAQKYGIESIPTVIYFDANGKEINRTNGAISDDEFKSVLDALLGK